MAFTKSRNLRHSADRIQHYDFYLNHIGLELRYLTDRKLEEYGITNAQARLLGAIYRSSYDGADITRKLLEQHMNISGPSVTSLLNGLEKKELIVRSATKEDGRAIDVKVTEKGIKILNEIREVFVGIEKIILKDFTDEEKALFLDLLSRSYKNIAAETK